MVFAATKGNPSVIDWAFPGTLQEVWAALLPSRQQDIALDCASTAERRNIPVTTRLLANKLNCTAQAISALAPQELARHIVTFAASDPDALDEIFRVYFSFRHKKMVARFLEHLQIRTDAASDRSKQAKAELESAIADLLREFRHDDVMLYTQVLSCQNPTFWGELSRVKFKASDVSIRNTEPAEPYVPRVRVSQAIVAPVTDPPSGDEPMRTAQELQSDLHELTERFSRAADELQATVADLRAGKLPSSVGEAVENLGPAFAKLAYEICARAAQLGIQRSGDAYRSIDDLTPAVAAIEEKEKALADAERVTRMLGQVLELTTTNGRDFQPLESMKESARSLQQELSAAPASPDPARQERLHAFELVLKMVDSSTPGEDENAEDVVAQQFGAKLLYALGTGKIVRSATSQAEMHSASSSDTPSLPGVDVLVGAAENGKAESYSEAATADVAQTDVA